MLGKQIILSALAIFFSWSVSLSQDAAPELTEGSKHCISCHGSKHYSVHNDFTGLNERKFMNPYFIIDSVQYLKGVHKTFSCDDCHSPEYETYPHSAELKMEPQYTCLDCHGGDDMFAHLQFDEIAEEVEQSIHVEKFGMGFRCEMCHDPHTYKLISRNDKFSIKELVQRNNNMCLTCHNSVDQYQKLSDNENPALTKAHKWLPNQRLHFSSVRCIECHTPTDDTLNVSHKILSKEFAVRECAECHSSNSLLEGKLYKYRAKEIRSSKGFYNALIMNEAYVIGANRNKYLNNISLLIFGLTLGGILIHIVMRIVKRK